MRYGIRPMQLEDVAQANEIDRECFPEWPPVSYRREILFSKLSHYIVVWDRGEENPAADQVTDVVDVGQKESRFGRFRRKARLLLGPLGGWSSATNQRIIGLAGLWIMAGEAHLTTIGVREAYRRQGIGELLMLAIIELALRHNARLVTLEVRLSNLAAQRLYEKHGFSRVGLRRGYYTDNREDAIVMSTDELPSDSFQSRFQQLKQVHAQRWGTADCQIG